MSYQGVRAASASGPSLAEKAKIQMRRPTPDSDALASSDEDHDHAAAAHRPAPPPPVGARRPSSGWLHDIQPNRKFSLPTASLTGSQPTTPAAEPSFRGPVSSFTWNTRSFSAQTENRASRYKESVPSPTTIHPMAEKAMPSPTDRESDDGIGFLLSDGPGPVRKSVRSQSYSVGQHEHESGGAGQFSSRLRSSLRHRPSKPSLLGESAVGLGQVREDDADEVESSNGSEHGVRLPPTGYWDQQKQTTSALLKQAAVENARVRNRATSTSSPVSQHHRKATQGFRNMSRTESDYAIEELDDADHRIDEANKITLTRRFSELVGVSHREPGEDIAKKHQWTSPSLSMDPLGRRHSFATVGTHHNTFPFSTLSNTYEEDESPTGDGPPPPSQPSMNSEHFDPCKLTLAFHAVRPFLTVL